jgi:hypothetical protein
MTRSPRAFFFLLIGLAAATSAAAQTRGSLPRMPDGKPNLQGIWQAASPGADYDLRAHRAQGGVPAGRSVIDPADIPYLPPAATARLAKLKTRQTADPLESCYMPGVPRIMLLPRPFQIFQTPAHLAMTFEWSQVYRLVYTNGSQHPDGIEFWMGDSRGHWEDDTLVVEVTNHNDKTWFDAVGDFHSADLRLVERYTLRDANTIDYQVTVEDPKTFSRPWTITVALKRRTDVKRLMEYQCQAEKEEANGAFEREARTWYPKDPAGQRAAASLLASTPLATPGPARFQAGTSIARMPDGKPDLQGHYQSDGGGANYGLQKHPSDFLTPASRGIVVDPADGILPMQEWALEERKSRETPERGYDDPTAHCFVAGVPRSMYTPSPIEFIQTPEYLVMLMERMSWRIVPLDGRSHLLPDNVRLWQGDSIGRWEGDALVVETTNLNGKTWLNEIGEIVSHAERVVERFTPMDGNILQYEATVTDPVVYSKPWTVAFAMRKQKDEILEVACHEDNQDLQHLKDVRDAARAARAKQGNTK